MGERMVEILDEVDVREVVMTKTYANNGRENIDDGFYVCDLGDVVNKHEFWLENFPRVHPYYAVKACPHHPLTACLAAMGSGFDCASKAEIEMVLQLGGDPDLIIFANTWKQVSHLLYAKRQGVKNIVVDHKRELIKVKEHFPDANVVLRIKGQDSPNFKTINKTSTKRSDSQAFNEKYGATAEDCRVLMQTAKDLSLNVSGISFHVGSGCLDASLYVETLKDSKKLFDFGKRIGYKMSLLDIGGGFMGVLDMHSSPGEMACKIGRTLDELFPTEHYADLRIIAEPGRFYCASAFSLATNIIGKRGDSANPGAVIEYFINDGIYGAFAFKMRCICENEMGYSALEDTCTASKKHRSCIWGQTCDPADCVVKEGWLPEMDIGDWILWENMGAYTLACSTDFNGFKTGTVYDVISEKQLKRLKSLVKDSAIARTTFRRHDIKMN